MTHDTQLNDVLAMLDRYERAWPAENPMIQRVRRLLRDRPDCLRRACPPGHLTGSAWVLSPDRRRCLLVRHAKLNKWLQPGGHADGDGDLARVAMREVAEETGVSALAPLPDRAAVTPLDLDVHQIPARLDAAGQVTEPAHEHHDFRFLFAAVRDEPLVVSDESHEVAWLTPTEVCERTQEESVLRMLRKARGWMAP